MNYSEINFSPFQNNVLDYINKELVNWKGEQVFIRQDGIDFVIIFDGKEVYRASDNLDISYFLNQYQVGIK